MIIPLNGLNHLLKLKTKMLKKSLVFFLFAISLNTFASLPVSVSTSGTASVCPGTSTSISAIASGGTAPYSYLWMPGSLSGGTIIVSPATTTTYTVTATDSGGGTGTGTVTITVLSLPTVSFNSNFTNGCSPLCVNFTDATTLSSGTITNWNWNFGDGNTSNLQNPMNCYSSLGMYTVTLSVTSSDGCSATISIPNYLTVHPNPVANFSSSLSPPYTVNFTDLSNVVSGSITSWDWDFGDGNFSSIPNPVHTYAGPGNYNVQLTVQTAFACMDAVSSMAIVAGINEYYLNDQISISPNPLNTFATIEFKNNNLNLQNSKMILFDVLGKEIKKIEIDSYKTIFEKGELNSGIYFYKVLNQNQIISTGKLAVD